MTTGLSKIRTCSLFSYHAFSYKDMFINKLVLLGSLGFIIFQAISFLFSNLENLCKFCSILD